MIKSTELIGYFVSPDIWCQMLLGNVRLSQSFGPLLVLAGILRGSQASLLKPHLQEICSVLSDPIICQLADVSAEICMEINVISSVLTFPFFTATVVRVLFCLCVTECIADSVVGLC